MGEVPFACVPIYYKIYGKIMVKRLQIPNKVSIFAL